MTTAFWIQIGLTVLLGIIGPLTVWGIRASMKNMLGEHSQAVIKQVSDIEIRVERRLGEHNALITSQRAESQFMHTNAEKRIAALEGQWERVMKRIDALQGSVKRALIAQAHLAEEKSECGLLTRPRPEEG